MATHQSIASSGVGRAHPIWRRCAPALTLVLLAPLITEVLPGATRFSSMFVFPIQMCVWGGGALLIREVVRRMGLGWRSLLLLALALAIAEECLIQQTSLAPLVIKLNGVEYARAFGFNYVYFLWALGYESIFVVMIPVALSELLFPMRASEPWVSRVGVVATVGLFLLGCVLAWFTWTRIALPKVFHLPAYEPPVLAIALACVVIIGLVSLAIGPVRMRLRAEARPLGAPVPAWLCIAAVLWAVLWFGLLLLAFGISPAVPPLVAIVGGLSIAIAIIALVPRWAASAEWSARHIHALVFGSMLGTMLIMFVGFIGATNADLFFKIIVDAIAIGLLVTLGVKLRRITTQTATPAPSRTK